MPTFEYDALTTGGRLMKGTVEAASRDEALQMLEGMQLTVNRIEKAAPPAPRTTIGRNEFLLFNQQLAAIAEAGIPLERSLRELTADVGSKSMRRLVQAVADDLEAGEGIQQAFEKRRKHFPPLYGHIVAAGVTSGRLGEMLTSLNRHLETAGQTRRIIFEAACYPAVVLALAAVVLTGILVFVVPQFALLYEGMPSPGSFYDWEEGPYTPPAVTLLVFRIAENVGTFWIGVAIAAGALVALKIALSRFAAGRRFKERLVMNLPVVGRIYRAGVLGRLADAMALLVGAGCDMPSCLRLAAAATGSENLCQEANRLASGIEQGNSVWQAGQACRIIPRLFVYSLEWGSHRGELQDNLYGLAEMYTQQARANQGRLRAVLSPAFLLGVAAIVALIILALFLPFIQLIKATGGML